MGLIDRLSNLAQADFLADSESDSERSGYLSWRGEFHAAAWGLSTAFLAALLGQPMILIASVGWLFSRRLDPGVNVPYRSQLRKESLYVAGHAIPGYALGLILSGLTVV